MYTALQYYVHTNTIACSTSSQLFFFNTGWLFCYIMFIYKWAVVGWRNFHKMMKFWYCFRVWYFMLRILGWRETKHLPPPPMLHVNFTQSTVHCNEIYVKVSRYKNFGSNIILQTHVTWNYNFWLCSVKMSCQCDVTGFSSINLYSSFSVACWTCLCPVFLLGCMLHVFLSVTL
jgi:hypothetical protein